MSFIPGMKQDEVRQLLGDDIEEWRCPKCGQFAYTHKSQGALMVKCSGDHGNSLWWMRKVTQEDEAQS